MDNERAIGKWETHYLANKVLKKDAMCTWTQARAAMKEEGLAIKLNSFKEGEYMYHISGDELAKAFGYGKRTVSNLNATRFVSQWAFVDSCHDIHIGFEPSDYDCHYMCKIVGRIK
ncbi:hypothetical protein BPS13_0111 [Bacillus phage BPS13]|uniref:Uncharacterized protein n=2 Tax=Wphvirus TaxID=1922327 RepID=W5QU98_9CAUD|nr:hypothetical protein BPS13_0111 [Bacillus phage BPS13]YP_009002995.1 hypothetical protein BPS10C_109 [Bacillus phage BPS10C]AEZ50290.1 hypothetical protein BPS13_0111 [Bacillus phage BPS13]AGI12106.1 hypothetical protein BPS10C_109 [Bacillus phage BPS10C]